MPRFLLGLVLALVTMPAQADPTARKAANLPVITHISGPEVVALLQDAGLEPSLATDDAGDPLVRAQAGKTGFAVIFYDCDEAHRCSFIQFRSFFTLRGDGPLPFVNEWNRARRLGRAFVDADGDPTLEHNLRLVGGVTPEWLKSQRDWFLLALRGFETELRKAVRPQPATPSAD